MDDNARKVSVHRHVLSALFPQREPERSPRKPAEIEYGVDDTPPPSVTWLSGLQQAGQAAVSLVIPLLICREAHVSHQTMLGVISWSILVLAVAPVLQAFRRGPVGCGYLAPGSFSTIYLDPAAEAAQLGGLPLMSGMTLVAGLFEVGISRVLSRLRPFFPPEIAGLVIFLVGVRSGTLGLQSLLAIGVTGPVPLAHWFIGLLTLATMVALNIWTKGLIRISCVLIGLMAGYVGTFASGLLWNTWLWANEPVALFALPPLDQFGFAFDRRLVIPFLLAAIASTLKAMAVVTAAQRTGDADWVRADMRRIARGVLADGLVTALSGVAGTSAASMSSSAAVA
jgi:NCS2 family nucleobase:cation symporter-2